MSIAAISQSFVAAVRGTSPVKAREHAHGTHRPAAATREPQGRRHELVDGMNQALGVGSDATKVQMQAVFRFARTLMHDLRELDGSDDRRGQGRREWSDLPQRLVALAAAASREPATAQHTDSDLPDMDQPAEPTVVPELPRPATPASIAVHMAQVPSSHLLEAFVAMQRALGREQDDLGARSGLAALATQIASALQPGAKSELPAGSVVHLTA
jgi:hypothetical protein